MALKLRAGAAEDPTKDKSEDHDSNQMLAEHHKKVLWVYWTLLGLGVWMLISPFSFGYLNSNAADAIDSLAQKWIKVKITDAGERVEIVVTDSGPGVPENARDKLFQPFFTTKPVGKGTGLGLSISKGIIESHGGSLTLDPSKPNTSFIVKLPKRAAARSPAAA